MAAVSWLNNEFFSVVLQASADDKNCKAEDFRIVDFRLRRILDDCSGISYSVQVWYKQNSMEQIKDHVFVIKSAVLSSCGNFVEREITMFKDVLPKVEKYVGQKFAPKLLLSKNLALVTENVRGNGFKNANSLSLLDFNHCAMALQALARFHAGTVLLHLEDPDFVENKVGSEQVLENPEVDCLGFMDKVFRSFEKELSTWPESKHHVGSVQLVRQSVAEYFQNINKRKGLRVLNNGDFWLNNLMFRYDACGRVRDVLMCEFQSTRYCPPAADVQYFIASSSRLDVRLNQLDTLLEIYRNTLNESLETLDLPQRLEKDEMESSLQEEYVMYFIGLVVCLCTCLNDPEDRMTFEGFDNFEELAIDAHIRFEKMLRSPRFRNFVPPVLEDLERKGVFDIFRDKINDCEDNSD
uniref:CHK kinase-like domain-containing protein n=1 Tax=Clastoptera arizonana TaxID=38151 RepID=A0A1B6DHA2_9HEMI